MVTTTHDNGGDAIELMPEIRANTADFDPSRKLTVSVDRQTPNEPATGISVRHGGKEHALDIYLNRTIRVPDNRDINSLPPGLGHFPLFKIRDYPGMPKDILEKGGIFFPMYQREAMWISFTAAAPFAIKIYVGGVNAVSGFPMTENEMTKEKRQKMLSSGKSIQDYMVVPEQHWLDGIASEDGKIRQFVAEPKGNGFSVEAQVTGEEKVGGIQIEIIPIKKHLPTEFDVRYEDKEQKVITRTFNLAEKGLTPDSTWQDVKERIRDEFDIAVQDQSLSKHSNATRRHREIGMDFGDEVKLGDVYFPPQSFTLSVTHAQPVRRGGGGFGRCRKGGLGSQGPMTFMSCIPSPPGMAMTKSMASDTRAMTESAPAPTPNVKEMGLAAGGLITQSIEADPYPADVWDVEASVMMNLTILDIESFGALTGQPAPNTPVDAKSYAQHGYPFFELWGEEKSGIKGEFQEVKSVAQLMKEAANADGKSYSEEETVMFKTLVIGRTPFRSTFRPVEILCKEVQGLHV
ncbi:integral membrane protein [Colletotrichum camelliae]|nr:integral membrane protein [Colletotrichum camelliae]